MPVLSPTSIHASRSYNFSLSVNPIDRTLAKHAAKRSCFFRRRKRANDRDGEEEEVEERSRAKEQRIKERARQKWAIAAARSRGSRRVVIALDRYPNMASRYEGVGEREEE